LEKIMQVFQVLDRTVIDVQAIADWTAVRKDAVRSFPGSVADGFQDADCTTALQVGAISGRSAGRVVRVATCVAKGIEVTAISAYRASAQHWADHGADYRAVVQFAWALWLLQAREVMGCDTSEEMATAVALLPEVVAIQGRVQGVVREISVSTWSDFRDWVLATRVVRQAIAKYEAMRIAFWLVAVAK
jgi:hypothetical protein